MIELIEEAKSKFKELGDAYLSDKHVLRNGIYIKVQLGKPISEEDVLVIKSQKAEYIQQHYPIHEYNWFKSRDFFISNIMLNKVIDGHERKVLSTVPYALHIKAKCLPDRIKEGLCKHNQIDLGRNPTTKAETFEKVLYYHFKKMGMLYPLPKSHSELAEYFVSIVDESMKNVASILDDVSDDVSVKWFLDVEPSLYKEYQDQYLQKRVFVREEYNYEDQQGNTWGASSFLMTLNKNKPLLISTTTSFRVPYRISIEDAIFMFRLSPVLYEVANELGYDLEYSDTFDILGVHKRNEGKLAKPFTRFKILQVPSYEEIKADGELQTMTRKEFEQELNRMFHNLLYPLYRLEDKSQMEQYRRKFTKLYNDGNFYQTLLMSRSYFRNYFYEELDINLHRPLSQLFDCLLIEEVRKLEDIDYTKRVRSLWDLIISILAQFKEGVSYMKTAVTYMGIHESTLEQFQTSKELFKIDNDHMFYYLMGQAYHFMLAHSNTANRSGRMLADYFQIRDVNSMKESATRLFETYAYKLSFSDQNRLNRVLHALLLYVPTEKCEGEYAHFYYAGMIGKNLFYTKGEQNSQGGEQDDE